MIAGAHPVMGDEAHPVTLPSRMNVLSSFHHLSILEDPHLFILNESMRFTCSSIHPE